MKVRYTTQCGRIGAEFEGDSQADIFRQIASFQEVFESALVCRKNKMESKDIRFVVRQDKDENEYFEARVISGPLAGTKKSYGQYKKPKGGLFARSKDSDGNWLPDNGWVKWDADKEKEV